MIQALKFACCAVLVFWFIMFCSMVRQGIGWLVEKVGRWRRRRRAAAEQLRQDIWSEPIWGPRRQA